ncbi:PREDICTED: structural maintenance of chromosomes protein 2 [Dufourea novaeangliae]|uniref:Structural maintenance of chromosomes protein n=1 Tax=Dufourea novaeangliae TaxID=178035 RepID=A0A154PPR1_DUFNO|nr:PREDICTED: structural maintenance of chromosomes protein 2 [Dufourea novaeangliae]KZC13859.1 Structural maintenance of chromosomes protein 2 [Dufourea novaeangliae]
MHIKCMVLEGFKSYGKRIEINGFDTQFNAITGFNGTGKSNILDAICFVLGISNLGQVRAASLQDLVYKSGQAGIKKASVTITFDNRDRNSSPMGYEHHEEITVTRQVVIGGKNKYLINGSNVPNKRVQDMFCSVQLNVNNPHFLIMQGRITKVLNMKPLEILSMIEEAAGTRMYENKKEAALKTIEKKDSKLKEINDILKEEIGPRLAKLKEEKMQYVEFQRIERELEHCKRICLAWKYVKAINENQKAEENVQAVKDKINEKTETITNGEKELENIDIEYDEIVKQRDAEAGGQLQSLQTDLKNVEKKQYKLSAEVNSSKENIKAAIKGIEQLKTNIKDDENVCTSKQLEYAKVEGLFKQLKEMDEQDSNAVLVAQEKYQKIMSGLLESQDGENATLEQQLITAKQTATEAQTQRKQCEMTLNHNKEQLKIKKKDLKNTGDEYKKYTKDLENKEKDVKNFENELKKLNYEDGTIEQLKQQRHVLKNEIRALDEKVDHFESRYPQIRFEYQKPEANFNTNSVKGVVCKLVTVKDNRAAYALDIAAGGKLYNVIVDTEKTSKQLLQRGQLQQRVTIIPLNKVNGRAMDNQMIHLAQKIGGVENVHLALSLIDFPEETRSAMTWIFGQIFVCKDIETAKKIAFHDNIRKKCVTLEGDVVDPAGTLSGGAPSKSGSVLLKLEELKAIQNELNIKQQTLQKIEATLASLAKVAERYMSLKQKLDLQNYEIGLMKQKLEQTVYYKMKEEIDELEKSIEELLQKMATAEENEKVNTKRAEELEHLLKDSTNIREKQLKDAKQELENLKKKAETSRKEWQKREQKAKTLELEIKELQKSIDTGKEQLLTSEKKLNSQQEETNKLEEELSETQANVKQLQCEVKKQNDIINKQDVHMRKLLARKEDIIKQNKDAELDIKKLNHEINSIKKCATDCKQKVSELLRKYDWIEQDKIYFGKAGGIYDFEVNKPDEMEAKVHRLQTLREKLSRSINTRAISLFDKEEEQYHEMMKKKKIVENDKRKILETIKHLDEKKKETLLKAWEQVNKDFGSIFSSLLPGADAKLQPPENQTVTEGLEVKIAFSGIWKESLGELSGGQRSLVALSLILAMLLFKPAPLYILDEVDAALDLSHTENIGIMLKRHFKHSQFIVVSLKDGMFNNANVIYTTRFVDGMSTISRSERVRNR